MNSFWNASWVPEAAVRTTRSIGPVIVEPATSPQSRTLPEKMSCTCACDRSPTVLPEFVDRQIASRAILYQCRPPGSVGFASRDELPIETRPAPMSATPTSEPPWASVNDARFGYFFRYALISLAASGATEVDPLMVILGFAAALCATIGRADAVAGASTTAAAVT